MVKVYVGSKKSVQYRWQSNKGGNNTIIFVLLKVFGVISWSWWIVFLPEIIAVVLYLVVIVANMRLARKVNKRIEKHFKDFWGGTEYVCWPESYWLNMYTIYIGTGFWFYPHHRSEWNETDTFLRMYRSMKRIHMMNVLFVLSEILNAS